ncbi:hypothetical protein C8T65DRAFT_746638 [Cerioporus squamosus]|nr:hypothetical protein C8T65DRAFT_746638 [Cerioporus squamosus]
MRLHAGSLESYAGISSLLFFPLFATLPLSHQGGLYAGLSSEVVGDLIVALSQCILLPVVRGCRCFTACADEQRRLACSAIRVLMTFSVNIGLLTILYCSLCAIGALVSYSEAVQPTKFIKVFFYCVLSDLYVNSLLAPLNGRGSLLGRQRRHRDWESKNNSPLFLSEVMQYHADGVEPQLELVFDLSESQDVHMCDVTGEVDEVLEGKLLGLQNRLQ